MPSFPSGANWTQSGFLSRRDRPARRFGRALRGEGRLGLWEDAACLLDILEDNDVDVFEGLFGTTGFCGKIEGGGEESVLRLEE